ncbi:STM4015 family protein [Streptomyces sp. NPDC127033]|uniref:STM4015 family protein n=1 Tax=Streptomyces sp. NPDC127033 TaxID=3347110 RepID=UPI00365B771E
MTVNHYLRELYGLPVFDFPGADGTERRAAGAHGAEELPDPASVAWRVSVGSYEAEESWEEAFARFTTTVDTTGVRALVVGSWSDAFESGSEPIVAALVAARDRLPGLRALFVGDMTSQDCEISWINQSRISPLLEAFPGLEEFGARGGTGLEFSAVRHERLRSLTVETGGLDADVVRGIGASDLPALERLDLWLGSDGYGANADVSDLAPVLAGSRLPRLRHLALRNSVIQDEIAVALAGAPVVAGLESLDLSMGTFGDEGAEALLGGQPLTHLKKLDVHHHFLSEAMQARLAATLGAAGVEVDLSGAEVPDSWGDQEHRYVAVAE